MAEIEVLQPGLFSTIQDRGRVGYMKFGVPISGAMDSYAAKMANLLLNNQREAAVLEITQMGPKLKFHGACRISLCGADLLPKINDEAIPNYEPVPVQPGDILSFGGRKIGCRAYLGISGGGFITEEVLESKSWYEDLTEKYHLEKEMKLHFREENNNSKNTFTSVKTESEYLQEKKLKVFPGPEFKLLPEKLQQLLQRQRFTIDKNNRMAVQLKEPLENNLSPILTGPVLPGTVQLTPSGKLIVLMRDCQTTGGYPRVLQLSEHGINTMAQKTTGENIVFRLQK